MNDAVLPRRRFMALGAAGIAVLLAGCSESDDPSATGASSADPTFEGSVSIIGAGVAGMTAAHLLLQRGVDVEVLEAGTTYGGRIKHDLTFTDFPVCLGAEWLHTARRVLDDIVNDDGVEVTTQVLGYSPNDPIGFYDDELELDEIGDFGDLKFIGSSWLDFFDRYIVPGIESVMTFDAEVVAIDSTRDRIRLVRADGTTSETDRVIVTVPLSVLQSEAIEFTPTLPGAKIQAIADATVWGGIKVFLEFTEHFFPTFVEFPDSDTDDGQRAYYDAAYGQDTEANVLGLFAVGAQAEPYQALGGDELRDHVLGELDEIFDGKASSSYVRHIVQDWSAEPFIAGAYLADVEPSSTSRTLAESVDGRIFFAGEAYTSFDDWGSAHTAARAAIEAVAELLG